MKKLITTLLIVFTINIVSATTPVTDSIKKEVSNTLPDSTQSVFKSVYTDIKSGLVALESALKVGAEHVYEVLIKQQIIYSITYLIIGIVGLVLMLIFVKKIKSDEKWNGDYEPTILGVLRVTQGIVSIALLIIFFVNIENVVTGLVNPEHGAIKEIINIVK